MTYPYPRLYDFVAMRLLDDRLPKFSNLIESIVINVISMLDEEGDRINDAGEQKEDEPWCCQICSQFVYGPGFTDAGYYAAEDVWRHCEDDGFCKDLIKIYREEVLNPREEFEKRNGVKDLKKQYPVVSDFIKSRVICGKYKVTNEYFDNVLLNIIRSIECDMHNIVEREFDSSSAHELCKLYQNLPKYCRLNDAYSYNRQCNIGTNYKCGRHLDEYDIYPCHKRCEFCKKLLIAYRKDMKLKKPLTRRKLCAIRVKKEEQEAYEAELDDRARFDEELRLAEQEEIEEQENNDRDPIPLKIQYPMLFEHIEWHILVGQFDKYPEIATDLLSKLVKRLSKNIEKILKIEATGYSYFALCEHFKYYPYYQDVQCSNGCEFCQGILNAYRGDVGLEKLPTKKELKAIRKKQVEQEEQEAQEAELNDQARIKEELRVAEMD
jgi:hypothetical protein